MLPAETMDCIFSFLQRDQAALNNCSAALPLLSPLIERHLFAHMIFYIGFYKFYSNHPRPTDEFTVPGICRRLSKRSYLAHYIRSITFDGSAFSYPPPKAFEELSTVLSSISRLDKVILRHIGWSDFSEDFRSALLDCLRKPGMKEIYLHNSQDFPLTILDDFRNIKNLRLGSSLCSYMYHPVQPQPTTSLESLSLVDVNLDRYITWAGSKLNNLISLHVKVKFQSFPNLSPIFNHCLDSLRSLTLEIGTFYRTPYREGGNLSRRWGSFPFDLSTLPCLGVVSIYAMMGAGKYPIQAPHGTVRFVTGCNSSLPAITDLVASAGPSLNHLILNLDFKVEGASYLHDVMEWKPLVQFCESLRHPQVDLCIRASTSHVRLPFAELVNSLLINKDLSRLVEWGSLVIRPFPLE